MKKYSRAIDKLILAAECASTGSTVRAARYLITAVRDSSYRKGIRQLASTMEKLYKRELSDVDIDVDDDEDDDDLVGDEDDEDDEVAKRRKHRKDMAGKKSGKMKMDKGRKERAESDKICVDMNKLNDRLAEKIEKDEDEDIDEKLDKADEACDMATAKVTKMRRVERRRLLRRAVEISALTKEIAEDLDIDDPEEIIEAITAEADEDPEEIVDTLADLELTEDLDKDKFRKKDKEEKAEDDVDIDIDEDDDDDDDEEEEKDDLEDETAALSRKLRLYHRRASRNKKGLV